MKGKGRKKGSRKATPAGNAIYDPREQSRRADLRPEEQGARGVPRRGSEPPAPGKPPRVRLAGEAARGTKDRPVITGDPERTEQG